MKTHYFIVPGYRGSGSKHWQTYFEQSQSNIIRIEQKDWDHPNIQEWAENIEKAIAEFSPNDVVLVAHSLGCLTVAAWAEKYNRKIKAALLVAPPDDKLINQRVSRDLIKRTPSRRFPFPTTLVASTNDPWASIEKAQFYAEQWGSDFMNIGAAGHINADSGHYQWEEGLKILRNLEKRVAIKL